MKKYISLLLATAATIACTKVALEDNSPIESLPQDDNTENVQGEPSGEKIIISLAETKVSLDENGYYQFDGDEVIYVKARSRQAVAKLQNSAAKPTTFTGVFNGLLGKDSETFDFYYNCTDENANVVTDEKKVQNGQPWLAATVFDVQRSTSSKYSYELSGVLLKQLEGYVCLALNSGYPCTVDFHTLTTALPNGETTISGIQLGSGSKKPYFVNIVSGMTGGFYLTVTNPKGQKMYTSYGTTAKISSNQIIKTKEFEAFYGVSNLEITGFETTYSYYSDNNSATDPNSKKYSWMNEGTVTFNLSGISSSLVDFTFNNGDYDVTVKPVKSPSGNLFTCTFVSTDDHTTFGEKILKATVSFKDGIEPGATKETTAVRHITGLPYNACPTKDTWEYSNIYDWNISKITYGGGLMYNSNGYIKKSFYIPQGGINATVSHSGYARKGALTSKTTTFSIYVGSTILYTKTSTSTSSPGEKTNVSYDIQFTKTENYIKCMSTVKYELSTYATTNNISVHYR
ncbi:MAG: hypothetical protein PUI52_01580 [Bacteroidales bacterium]|nr:hypothetical protein [Bacteroidales bacterium]MDY6170635.1 hypothetical protein [Candidatus Cryptobacteroides sp.]